MRIASLRLLAFGHFRGLELDLSAPGLHVVFGRNEAGKSTTLRAIAGLLYGIDTRTRDAHVHKPADLRIGGTLEGSDGARLSVVRRKGTANTLLDERGQAIEETPLLRMLRGVTEETFKSAFGLDLSTLEKGASALLEGKGDVGGSLFDASVGGGTDAQRLLVQLTEEADAIYKPRASALPLNVALKAYEEAKKEIAKRQSLPEAYTKQVEALEEAKKERAAKAKRRAELAAEQTELSRAKGRLPLERRRAELTQALAPLEALVKGHARVASLHSRLVAYDASDRDRRTLASEAQLLGDRAAEAARRAGLAAGTTSPMIDERTATRIRSLVGERTKLVERLELARVEIERAERELARLRGLAAPPAGGDDEVALAALSRALERARALGDVKGRLASETAKVGKRRAEVEARVAALRAFVRPAADLALMKLPANETIDRLAKRAEEADRVVARLGEGLAALESEERARAKQIAAQSGDFAPPSAADLDGARKVRDAAWARLREARAAGKAAAGAIVELEAEVERAIHAADTVADRMIREADRVTTLARLRAEQETNAEQRAALTVERDAAIAARAALDAEHVEAWKPAGIAPLGFAEMRAWLERHASVVDAFDRLREAELDAKVVEEQLASARAELAAASGHRDASGDRASLDDLALAASARIEQATSARRARADAAREVAKVEAALDERRAASRRDETALADARARLAELSAPLGLPEDASGDEIQQALAAMKELFVLEDKRREVAARAALAEADARAFEDDAARAAADLAPDLVGLPARDVASNLHARSQRALADEQELANTVAQLAALGDAASAPSDPEAAQRRLDELREEIEALDAELSRLDSAKGGIEVGLQAMGVDSGAAEASAAAQEALARVRASVERYCRAKVAAVVLAREIERYREENQGPMLSLASRLFARLTLGGFTGVRAGFDDKDRPALRCVRDGNVEVDVAGLSQGTRDQLYLSLRLASLLRHAEAAEPMPLVLDDVFVHFDDERSRAAFAVLSEVAEKMQVVFFTHHARLVDLAREAVASERLTVHELAAPALAGAALASLEA